MKKATYLLGVVFFVLLLSITPIGVVSQVNKGYPPPFLQGNRIQLLASVTEITLPVDEPCFVIHGWMCDDWPTKPIEVKQEYLKDRWFELKIQSEKVILRSWRRLFKTYETPLGIFENTMIFNYYVQFEADTFLPGEYTFTGNWYGPSGPEPEWTDTVLVTFE